MEVLTVCCVYTGHIGYIKMMGVPHNYCLQSQEVCKRKQCVAGALLVSTNIVSCLFLRRMIEL